MIYFTEITKSNGSGPEDVAFQFYPKELPELIPHMYTTKINRIEYNGGFITNQIIGTFQEPIEWEGCFFGKYSINGQVMSAKDRAQEIKKFMGRPIRVGFPPPNDDLSMNLGSDDSKLQGDKGVYIIEEYETRVRNYIDVDYRIKLVPHMRQEKIKPLESDVIIVKVEPEKINTAAARAIDAGSRTGKKPLARAADAAANSAQINAETPFSVKEFRELKRNNPAEFNRRFPNGVPVKK